ncbi:envelope biogenesis factor ElyC [Erwinia sp. E602]|uniref:envelope biogenesis factor ElyC n=1 Tax=Erwinia sp. E602 TaxID=2675378 RepID=UPI001BA815CE|nr:envelope biogenesis factor ElyC [Erwinia sp. E602]QUG76455.1 envelope biogenesis factor ElyC [Erwinia sp. E602]
MLFTLKKAIGGLLMPLPALLLLIAVGILLLWFSRWQKTGKVVISLGWGIMLLFSLQPVADRLLLTTEAGWPTWQGQHKVEYVVVLGGGYTWNPDWAPSSNMLNNSLPRLAEGIRIWRMNPGSRLIVTGGAATGNAVSSAEVTSKVAQSLGVPQEAIIALTRPRDTEQEAREVARLIGQRPFALVTSASHLSRAMIFFEREGLHPLPAPANQMAVTSPLNLWEKILPAAFWLGHSERAVYEGLGRIWQAVKPHSSADEPGQQ